MGLTFNLKKPEQTYDLRSLSPGQTARIKDSDEIVYCAKKGLVVSLTDSQKYWAWDSSTFSDPYPQTEVIPVVFDAIVRNMPVVIWTENFKLIQIADMKRGQFGIICDESAWHGAMVFKHVTGAIHLSKAGSRFLKTRKEGRVQLVDLELRER